MDSYEDVALSLEEDVDEVEQSVFSTSRTQDSKRIYILKRELAEVRRAVNPLREPMKRFATGSVAFVTQEAAPFFRDVADHVIRAREMLDGIRDLLAGTLQANLAQVSVRQNDDVRKISAWVAIAAVPTAIAGIYGMNFRHMPELRWELGYPFALTLILVFCGFLYYRFKRAGWL